MITETIEEQDDILKWCIETFGAMTPPNAKNRVWFYNKNNGYNFPPKVGLYFFNDADMVVFKLKYHQYFTN